MQRRSAPGRSRLGGREKEETNARWTSRPTTSSSGEVPIKFHLAAQSPRRIAACREGYFLFRRGGELICTETTPFLRCLYLPLPLRAFYSLPLARISGCWDLVTSSAQRKLWDAPGYYPLAGCAFDFHHRTLSNSTLLSAVIGDNLARSQILHPH